MLVVHQRLHASEKELAALRLWQSRQDDLTAAEGLRQELQGYACSRDCTLAL